MNPNPNLNKLDCDASRSSAARTLGEKFNLKTLEIQNHGNVAVFARETSPCRIWQIMTFTRLQKSNIHTRHTWLRFICAELDYIRSDILHMKPFNSSDDTNCLNES